MVFASSPSSHTVTVLFGAAFFEVFFTVKLQITSPSERSVVPPDAFLTESPPNSRSHRDVSFSTVRVRTFFFTESVYLDLPSE